jgi:hypothetical protein
VDIYLVSPSGVELNLTNFGASSSHFVNEYPKGAFDIAPVEHISRYTADGLPYLDTYRRRPIVVDLRLTTIGSTAVNLWSEIATIMAQARMSKTPCKLKVVEGGKTVYLDVHPESSAVIPSVLSSDITLRLVSYGRWYSGTLRTETLTTRASQNVANIAARLQAGWGNVGGGVNSFINTMAVAPNGTLYAGGNFTIAGGVTVNYIAKWNGSSWSALGGGMNGGVGALAVAPDGTLYAGGTFTIAGGVTVNYIAKWNGSSWSALGSGMNGNVWKLAIAPDGTLYAGGDFTLAGGITVNHIAKWNGTSWSALGSGMNDYVNALAVAPDGTLYAGGYFTTAGGVTVNRIAKWNGASWNALGSGMNTGSVKTLAVAPDGTLYAGGSFTTAGGVTVNSVAKWDGSSWSALGSGMNANASVYALAVAPDGMLYVGGDFTTAGGNPLPDRIALWNGYRWLPIDIDFPGTPYIATIACLSNGGVYLGGTCSGIATYSAINTLANITSDVYPQLVITASTAATIQYIENQTVGKRVWLNYNMLPGEVLTLDFSQATATSSAWGNVLRAVAPGSDMKFSLTKGTNSVWLFVPTGTVTAQLSWYPQYETLAEALQ